MSSFRGSPRLRALCALLLLVSMLHSATAARVPGASAEVTATATVGDTAADFVVLQQGSANAGVASDAYNTADTMAAAHTHHPLVFPGASGFEVTAGTDAVPEARQSDKDSKRDLAAVPADNTMVNGLYLTTPKQVAQLSTFQSSQDMSTFTVQTAVNQKNKAWPAIDNNVPGGAHIDLQTRSTMPGVTWMPARVGGPTKSVEYIAVDFQVSATAKLSQSFGRVWVPSGNWIQGQSDMNAIMYPLMAKSMATRRGVTLFPARINSDGGVEIINFSEVDPTTKLTGDIVTWVAVLGDVQSTAPLQLNAPGQDIAFSQTPANTLGCYNPQVGTQMMVLGVGANKKEGWVNLSGNDLVALVPTLPDASGPVGGNYAGAGGGTYDSKNCRVVNRKMGGPTGRTVRRKICRVTTKGG